MISYFKKQIQEIEASPGMRWFGAFLSLTHLWCFLLWNRKDYFVSSLSPSNSQPLCFPFFIDCDLARVFSPSILTIFLYFYAFLGLLAFFLFISKETSTKAAYWAFAAAVVYKNVFYLSNYNFMGNYHYMANISYLAFLFLPHKKWTIKYLIVGFYFAAGALKINIEWLSAAAMIAPPYIGGNLLMVSLIYVIYLELVLVFFLLCSNKWLRWSTLFQFIAFHIFSWHIVGFFYPMVMFSLLSIFLIDEYLSWKGEIQIEDRLPRFFSGKEYKSIYIVLVIFTLMQTLPFVFASDPSKSGAIRLSSLNMFDANTRCKELFVLHRKGQVVHLRRANEVTGVRIQCDPILFTNYLHQLCRENKQDPDFEKLSFSLVSRRATEADYEPILFIENACAQKNIQWAEFSRWGRF
ncbi:MAG: hypothetical protein KDD33_05840 [Bdellovibrionales bacterium]|nr:hypothetical protein [Bdellovibrionales bacterium]